jgi:hypothetical protein
MPFLLRRPLHYEADSGRLCAGIYWFAERQCARPHAGSLLLDHNRPGLAGGGFGAGSAAGYVVLNASASPAII